MKSTDVIQPQAMASIFAEDIYSSSSTTNFEIPAATSTQANDTCVMDDGFLPITSEQLPPNGNGIAPARKNFNGLFYLSTDQRVFLQNGGFITYNATVANTINGYPKGALLQYIDSNGRLGFVKSLIDNNKYNFVTTPSYIDNAKWKLVEIANIQSQLSTKANANLSNCTKPYIVEALSSSNLPRWYRVYSDGWCEQGGYTEFTTNTPVALLKNYANTNWSIQTTPSTNTGEAVSIQVVSKTTSSFTPRPQRGTGNPAKQSGYWFACGFIS